jgi:hypothetical protein
MLVYWNRNVVCADVLFSRGADTDIAKFEVLSAVHAVRGAD